MFAQRVAQIYKPGDLIICHDYHLLLAPKMIREALGQVFHPNAGWGTAHPSPSLHHAHGKGFEWESNQQTPTPEKAKGEKIGAFMNHVGTALGNHLGIMEHGQQNEIMIGMFMHTPWPSSEIFRCLPSK